jgi:hypothetical protein
VAWAPAVVLHADAAARTGSSMFAGGVCQSMMRATARLLAIMDMAGSGVAGWSKAIRLSLRR